MPVKSSPPITLLEIKSEFGGNGALRSYLRGGGLVPNIPANSSIPTSGSLNMLQFLGARKDEVVTVTVGAENIPASGGFNEEYRGFYMGFNPQVGVVSPVTVRGGGIYGIYTWRINATGSPKYFRIRLSGSIPKNNFSQVTIQGHGTLYSSNATYTNNGVASEWEWDVTGAPFWDTGQVRTVSFI